MDLTAQQAKVDDLKTQLATSESSVTTIQSNLTQAETELTEGTLINQLESLTESDITAINAALLSDAANNPLGLSLALPTPPAAAPQAEETSQA